jgi:hypothetical protein
MNGWRWEDPRWREWTANDPVKIVLEALRRAVDIRDTNAQQRTLGSRPVILVDVLNALCASLDVSGPDLWDGTDLWDAPRFGKDYDEAAFWGRHNKG